MKPLRNFLLRLHQLPLAITVLLMGFGLTGLAWNYTNHTSEQKTKLQIDTQVNDAIKALDTRIDVYLNTFYAARGLWAAENLQVDYERWRSFVTFLELEKRYPGINGLGFIRYVPGNRDAYIQQTRSNNYTVGPAYANYTVKPEGNRPTYFVIEYCEPLQRNRKAIGLDVGHEPVRRTGAERARDTGEPAATGRIILVQDAQKTPGLLMYLPIYRPGMPIATVNERRQAFFGFIYAPFRVLDLVEEGIPTSIQESFDLVIYNGKDVIYGNEQTLTKNISNSRYYRQATLNVAGENWELHFVSHPSNTFDPDKALPTIVVATGIVASFLLAGIVWSLAIAYSKTKEAKEAADAAKSSSDAANQAKSEFLANMSHELRTPLNGILGYAQILQRSKALPQKERQGVAIIEQCGSHLLTLINDILDLSKIEARKLELLVDEFHFASFIDSVVEMCRIRAEQKGIAFQLQLDADLPLGIRADQKRLRQVLINLLGNAIKFTDAGHVAFGVKAQKLETTGLYRLRFQVDDTGMGMTPEQLEKIFRPFEQVGNRQKHVEGTGLGLAISQKIVALMGSEIQVKSQVGQGSTFWFDVELPEAKDWAFTSREVEQGLITGYKGEKRQILVVDDRWENRSVVVSLLEPLGFTVLEANNGQEGWDVAMHHRPDAIITDLMMPVMDGYQLLKQLRETTALQTVVAIASSASVFESNQQDAIDAGANIFLPKPLQAHLLLKVLQEKLQLEWQYEQSEVTPSSQLANIAPTDEISLPATEVLQTLLTLVQDGDTQGIAEVTEQLVATDITLKAFAQQVTQLVASFQLKQLQVLLERYLHQLHP